MNFSTFSDYLQQLEELDSRLEMTSLLAELFQNLDPAEIPLACYLMQGSLVPAYQSLEFEVGEKLMIRALAELRLDNLNSSQRQAQAQAQTENLFGQSDNSQLISEVKQQYKQVGDLGLVAKELVQHLTPIQESMSIAVVHDLLKQVAEDEGEGSQERKVAKLANLLGCLGAISTKYITRIVLGKLRLGFSTMTMIDALSWARHGDKSDRAKLEQAYQKRADIGALAQGYLGASTNQQASKFLKEYELKLGVPVLPALCQRLETTQEVIEKMRQVIVEPKYDGLRAQLHFDLEQSPPLCLAFTRSLDNVTHMFPELQEIAARLTAKNCIFDAEAIGYHNKTGELLPFQQTITRRRKHDVSLQAGKTPIRFFLFDLLYLDGDSLIDQPLSERKRLLHQIVKENQAVEVVEQLETSDPSEIQTYHHQQLALGLEGVVIKRTDSKYRAGRKGWRWVKLKEEEGESGQLSDSLDCVVMGYYRGRGKRAQFGIGAFLVGVLAENDQIKTIAKIGTGLTDDQFHQFKKLVKAHETSSSPNNYDVPKDLVPDVWLRPSLVVEIVADELTDSPIHTAGKALRFPRLEKFRTDKRWEQATSINELKEIRKSG